MGMSVQEIATLKKLMEYEASRKEPPKGFPSLPDIPAGRYIDPRFFELEKEHIWKKSWLFAAHIDEIPHPGSYILWENAGQPVIIVHGDDGEVYAHYNTCRHRGAPIVTESSGRKIRLTCKYHGWVYSHQGELLSVRDPEDFRDLDFSCRSLISIRCERFGNLIFVNFDEDCISLKEYLGPIVNEWEEFQFGEVRLAARHSFVLDCNWKIAMEANAEVYHVPSIHPHTVAPALDHRRNVNTFYPGGHGRMVAPRPAGANSAIELPQEDLLPEISTVGEIARTCTQSYGIFPNWVSPLGERAIPPLLFWPLSINKTLFEVWTMAPDWGDAPAPDYWTENNGESLNRVLREDTEFGVWIQKSMESHGFRGVPLSYQEARIYHWNQEADKIIGPENIPEELQVKQVMGDEWVYPNDPRVALAQA